MSGLAQRIASLSPEKLALLERRLKSRDADASPALRTERQRNNGSFPENQANEWGLSVGPEAIEAVLEQHPAVQEAAVAFKECAPGDKRLVAYLVPAQRGTGPVWRRLRLEIEDRLSDRLWHKLPEGKAIVHLNRSETEFVYREIFEDNSYLRHGIVLEPGACVFDVGAHIGLFTLYVSQRCEDAQIYAFEPLPPIFDVLSINTSLYASNVKLFNLGLANEEGAGSFIYYPHAAVLSGRYADAATEFETVKACLRTQQQHGAAEVILSDQEIDELLQARLTTEEFTCQTKTLSQVMRECGIEKIDLLKIDAEKSELDVLYGIDEADWPRIRQMVIEVHDIGNRLNLIRDILEGHGYAVTVEQDSLLADTGLYNVYAVRPREQGAALSPERRPSAHQSEGRWSSPEQLISEVRQFAKDRLPEPMTPAAFVLLRALPLMSNGGKNYHALPAPAGERNELKVEFIAPRNQIEAEIEKLWTEVFRLDRIGVYDDFFELGGTSLLAIQMVARAQEVLPVELSLRSLFENPTIAGLARLVTRAQSDPPALDRTEPPMAIPNQFSSGQMSSLLSTAPANGRSGNGLSAANPAFPMAPTRHEQAQRPSAIIRSDRGSEERLLANLDQLSDKEVDWWINYLMAEEDAPETAAAINPAPEGDRGQGQWHRPLLIEEIDAQSSAPSRATQAQEFSTLTSTQAESREQFEEAYLVYARLVQKAWWDSQKQSGEAYLNYVRGMQEAWIDGQGQQSEEAQFTYTQSMQKVWINTQKLFTDAYLGYVKTLQEIWLQADIEAIDPVTLWAISNSLAMAASIASNTLAHGERSIGER